jgi:hypothetical protein
MKPGSKVEMHAKLQIYVRVTGTARATKNKGEAACGFALLW